MSVRPEQDPVDPAVVLRFLAASLGELRDRVARIEAHAVSLATPGPRPRETVVLLQDMDLIRQMAEDLSRLAGTAAREDSVPRPALAAVMRLEALRDRLMAGPAVGNGPAAGADPGSQGRVDLFRADPLARPPP
jgi:hypothetical protein